MSKKLIRQRFRDTVFKRDHNKCVVCGATKDLDAHHITNRHEMPNGGYVKENGITLYPEHHKQAEVFHSTKGKEYTDGLHPDDLYNMIGYSHQQAVKQSQARTTKDGLTA